jgi:hypothetical protein
MSYSNFLTINQAGQLTIRVGDAEPVAFTSLAQARKLRNPKLPTMCSSSLDFPEEYTDNPAVIEMCRIIRG